MKIQPILLSPSLVDATLKGFKTQTRRTHGLDKFNQNPDRFRYDGVSNYSDQPQDYTHYFELLDIESKPTEQYTSVKAKMKPGDVFWVRETFRLSEFPEHDGAYEYKADMENPNALWNEKIWKPSIHMPKKACRLFLKITTVKCERLQDISNEDSISEGVLFDKDFKSYNCYMCDEKGHKAGAEICEDGFFDNAYKSFKSLWISINGEESWDLNPWVWVYEFEQCDEPENFKI